MIARFAVPFHVLVVDDDPTILRFLRIGLIGKDYTVSTARTGRSALKALHKRPTDLIVLGLGLPDTNGLDVIVQVRGEDFTIPIIVLSSRVDERSRIMALDLGADHCLSKPLSMEEFLAHVRVAQRHRVASKGAPPVVRVGDLTLDLIRRIVTVHGKEVSFSPREYELLRLLASYAGKVTHPRFHPARSLGAGHPRPVSANLYLRPASEDRASAKEAPLHPLRVWGRLPLACSRLSDSLVAPVPGLIGSNNARFGREPANAKDLH